MTGVDIEVARAALVIGLIFAALLYQYLGLVSGGAVTGTYIALMLFDGDWLDLAGWFVLSMLGLAAIRLAANTWPLPRNWLFAVGIIVPAGVHSVLISLTTIPLFTQWSNFLLAGLYVTSGLTAYDAQRQGVGRTLVGAGTVAAGTLIVIIPVEWGMELVRGGEIVLSAPTLQHPVTVFACVIIALGMRVGLRLGSAGIVGALFFLDMANIASATVVVAMAIIGTLVYRLVAKKLGLTPRQRLYSMLAVGAITSWFGLLWAEWLGVPGAEAAHQFGVEPLLVIGLMMGEMVRHGLPRMLGGSAIVFGLVFGVSYLAELGGLSMWLGLAGSIVVAAVFFFVGYRRMRSEWYQALAGGDRWHSDGHFVRTPASSS